MLVEAFSLVKPAETGLVFGNEENAGLNACRS